jgi:Ca2+-binding RTX toxin-like protein
MGSAYLYNGRTGSVSRTIVSPEPQIRSLFSGNFNAGRAVGDLGATNTPDILLPAPMQNVQFADEGKLWILNGDLTAGGGGEQSWNFGMLRDPEPYIGGNFGGGLTGVGDLVGGPDAPANEVLGGGFRFYNFTEASQNTVPDVNFMNATLNKNLMTIPHPEGVAGDGFGMGITPMGDINNDGFLDFGISAYLADGPVGGAGRAWIFKSDNSPPPKPPTAAAPVAAGPTTPATTGASLQAGACTNRTVGTDIADKLKGTLAGDEMWGFAGNDTVEGFQGEDCIDGGPGDDTIQGGDARDKIIGAGGRDFLYGNDGRDDLFGGFRNDRLYGGYGRDMLAGGTGDDRLVGGPDADTLYGEGGKDRIIGGDGRNRIDGGGGNDSIDARNGETDRVICGKGRDKVYADRADRLNGCETVIFAKAAKKK